jgi:two-component system response regulator RegX3
MTKILVVEDEASFSEALAYVLGKEGFEVIVADTGDGAIAAFDKSGADLVLLDLYMPEMDGFEVLSLMKEDERLS